MAHLTCVGSSEDELRSVIGAYAAGGVRDILALRGDPPGGLGTPWTAHPEGLDHAEDLVRLVRSLGDFTVGVAAFPDKHPEAASVEADADVLVRKFDAGAQFAVTQFVFDVASYARLRDLVAARGHTEPIVPGLMPVTSFKQVARMAQLSGTPLPRGVVDRLAPLEGDPRALRSEGVAIATELGAALLAQGAPGLHFYTMNRSIATLQVYRNLVGGRAGAAPLGAGEAGPWRGGAVLAVRRVVEAFEAGDWATVAAACRPDVEVDFPVPGKRVSGVQAMLDAAPRTVARRRVERMVYDGGRQVVAWLSADEGGARVHDTLFITFDRAGLIESIVALRAHP